MWIVIEKWFVQPLQTEDNDPKVHDHFQQFDSIKHPGDLMTHAFIIICIHLVCNISQTTQFSVRLCHISRYANHSSTTLSSSEVLSLGKQVFSEYTAENTQTHTH